MKSLSILLFISVLCFNHVTDQPNPLLMMAQLTQTFSGIVSIFSDPTLQTDLDKIIKHAIILVNKFIDNDVEPLMEKYKHEILPKELIESFDELNKQRKQKLVKYMNEK